MTMRKGLYIMKKLKEIGDSSYLIENFFYDEKNVTYTKTIPLGYLDYQKKAGLVSMDFNQTKRILILGGTGSGKTWLARSIISRCYFSGLTPVIMTDIAPEYYTSQFPLQNEFKKFLLDKEMPRTLQMKIYYPYFLYKFFPIESEKIKLNLFRFNLNKICPTDILAFFDYSKLSLNSRIELENIVYQMMEKDKRFQTIEEIKEYIFERNISNTLKNQLIRSFDNLENFGIFGDEESEDDEEVGEIDIINDINQNLVPDIILFGWQRIDMRRYVAIYLSLILRDILVARQTKKIKGDKHLLLVFEESHEFVPNKGDMSQEIIKKEIERALFTGRKEKISFIFITQTPERISETILSQCDYVFVPKGFETSKLKQIIKEICPQDYMSYYEFNLSLNKTLASLRKYPDGAREWLCIERGGRIFPFAPLGPLCHHKTEGETI